MPEKGALEKQVRESIESLQTELRDDAQRSLLAERLIAGAIAQSFCGMRAASVPQDEAWEAMFAIEAWLVLRPALALPGSVAVLTRSAAHMHGKNRPRGALCMSQAAKQLHDMVSLS